MKFKLMAVNPRISLVIDNNPTIIWEKVPTTTSYTIYTIKIIHKDNPGTPILDQTVSEQDLVTDGNFLKFMYPSTATPLEPLCPYYCTLVANDGKTASGDLMFLDSIRTDDLDRLTTLMEDSNVVTNPEVKELWKSTTEAILSSVRRVPVRPPWYPKPSCFTVKFD